MEKLISFSFLSILYRRVCQCPLNLFIKNQPVLWSESTTARVWESQESQNLLLHSNTSTNTEKCREVRRRKLRKITPGICWEKPSSCWILSWVAAVVVTRVFYSHDVFLSIWFNCWGNWTHSAGLEGPTRSQYWRNILHHNDELHRISGGLLLYWILAGQAASLQISYTCRWLLTGPTLFYFWT